MINLLRFLKDNESTISVMMGFLIIITIGFAVAGYFRVADVDYEEVITNPTTGNTIRCLDGRHVARAEFYESGAIKSVECTD